MSGHQLIAGPFSLDAPRGDTRTVDRNVLVAVHHAAAAIRLMDIVPLVEADRRVQTVYTVPPYSLFAQGAHDYLHASGALMVPWAQARLTHFDLALAAGQGHMEQLHAPIMTFPHGAGYFAYHDQWDGPAPTAPRGVIELGPAGLTRHGRLISSALMLAHHQHRRLLAQACPAALPTAVIAGDPCFDRLVASQSIRPAYRDALDAGPDQKLVVVTSRWGTRSLLGQHPDLLSQLAAQLPRDRWRIAVSLHPNTWLWHGPRQITAWYADCMRAGIILLAPGHGWQAALVAADVVIGDRGSVTCYAAALGVPVVLAAFPTADVVPGSHCALLRQHAPRLRTDQPLAAQLQAAHQRWRVTETAGLRQALTSAPGQAAAIIRRQMYRLLRLGEPTTAPVVPPVPTPRPCPAADRWRADR